MNGATAEPPPITINTPINNNTMITGASHHFLRSFINENKSVKKSISYLIKVIIFQDLITLLQISIKFILFSIKVFS
ncbi:hypothetical protein Dfri01_26360 [Dyadobacter frigoris]|nr:hypothetical protein Dfri01_26360 [Dyadobacter frigoris]